MRYKCCNLLTGGIEFGYNRVALCQRVDHIGKILLFSINLKTIKINITDTRAQK